MDERDRELDGLRDAHRQLLAQLAGLTDEEARRPSLLPGWTVGHVLTHLARNADGMRNMVEGAMRGEVAPQYPGGRDQRDADIEAGAGRGAAELCADVADSAHRLDEALAALTPAAWAGEGLTVMGPVAMAEVPSRRRREVEVHRADLGLGTTWRDWPADYVRAELRRMTMLWDSRRPMGMAGLPAAVLAVDEHHRLAWLLGRAAVDGVEPARLMG